MSVRELHSSSRFNKPAIANAKRTVKTTLIDGHVPMLSMPSRVAAVIIKLSDKESWGPNHSVRKWS
jgi:hypothetical protein